MFKRCVVLITKYELSLAMARLFISFFYALIFTCSTIITSTTLFFAIDWFELVYN